MTVEELIAELEQYDRDAEVRVAIQPQWPLACDVQNVVSAADLPVGRDDEPAPARDDLDVAPVVWIAVSQVSSSDESPYAPLAAWSGS
jgi:hypothetical protein